MAIMRIARLCSGSQQDGSSATARRLLLRRVPVTRWLPQYSRDRAVADAVAGFTLGLTIMPQSIAYALLAGLSPQYGLYSSFLGSLLYVLLGTVKEVSIGPTSLMALLTSEYTHDKPIQFVVLLTFLTGVVQLVMAILQLGFLVDLISDPVTSGFTSAYSVMILVSQLKGLLGLKFKAHGFVDTLVNVVTHIQDAKLGDTILGVVCVALLLGMRRLGSVGQPGSPLRRAMWMVSISRNAIVVVLGTILACSLEEVPFAISGYVEPGLPSLALPPFSAPGPDNSTVSFSTMASSYGGGVVVVPVVGVLANIAIAKAFSNGETVDASQEMLTLSVCNVLGSFVSSMPTCGAFTRSAVSNASGVRTPLAGLYSGVLVLLALSFLTPYFYYIPKATLSAVLISAVLFLVDTDIIMPLWRNSKRSLFTTALTFVACLGLGVEIGLLLGVAVDLAYLVYLWARPPLSVQVCKASCGEYVVVRPEMGLYFPGVDRVREAVLRAANEEAARTLPLVLDCTNFRGIDYTAIKGLEVLVRELDKRGQSLSFLGLTEQPLRLVTGLGMKGFQHCALSRDLPFQLFGEKQMDSLSRAETGLVATGDDGDTTGDERQVASPVSPSEDDDGETGGVQTTPRQAQHTDSETEAHELSTLHRRS